MVEIERETNNSSSQGEGSLAGCEGGNREEMMHAGSGSAGGDEVPNYVLINQNLSGNEEEEEGKDANDIIDS